MATNFKSIKAAIITALGSSELIQSAYDYERSTFEGFPATIVVPTDNDAEYGSNTNDRIEFVFKVRSYYPIPDEGEHDAAEDALTDVVDELLTLFSSRDVLGSACDWVEPAPSVWQYEERGEGVYRVAEITLKCVKYVS